MPELASRAWVPELTPDIAMAELVGIDGVE
jgi:hypothetical protein